MKTLKTNQLENVQGGQDDGTACGAGVAAAIIFPGPWTLLLAVALCVTGDSAQ